MTAQPRNRIVVFRLSQQEYMALKAACALHGGRNLSEFTRCEVLEYLKRSSLPDAVRQTVGALEKEVADLRAALNHLNGLLGSKYPSLANGQPEGDRLAPTL